MKPCVLVLVALVFWSSPTAAEDVPKVVAARPLPKEIVEAWKNVGAETGWMADGTLTLVFRPEESAGRPPVVPAFHFGDAWRLGVLAKLPAPAIPFGLSFVNMTNGGLKEFARMTNLQMLDVRTTNVNDAGLKELVPFKNLQSLKVGYRVTDKGLKEIAGLKSLKALYLLGGGITNAGLKELAALEKLQRLSLRNTLVTDQGMKELSALNNLQILDLYNTNVSDVGLKELATQKGLRMLELTNTEVTDRGVQELRKSLPGCRISFRKKKD